MPVMWEVEGNWPKVTTHDLLLNEKTGDASFNSPLLEAVSARVKDELVKVNSSSAAILRYTPPKDLENIVDSPETLRRKMEEIALLEQALAKGEELSPSGIMKNLNRLKKSVFEAKDTLDIEAPEMSEIVSILDWRGWMCANILLIWILMFFSGCIEGKEGDG